MDGWCSGWGLEGRARVVLSCKIFSFTSTTFLSVRGHLINFCLGATTTEFFFISCTAVVEVVSFSAWTSRCHRFWGCWCMWWLSLSRARSSTLSHLRIKVSISVELKVLASGLTEITPPPSKCSRSIVRNTISISLSPLSRMVTLSPLFDTCRGVTPVSAKMNSRT